MFPQLYGDGYHSIRVLLQGPSSIQLTCAVTLSFLCVLIFKPIVTSLTLASGGDGGIFAPSLFIGAFLGFFIAGVLNHFFNANVIPVNFMVIGMAAVLSASLHAPFTAVFLACGLAGNYTLMIPVITACLISKLTAQCIIPYTVYNYSVTK
jgi:CIC family chloride channel protein